MLKEVQLLLKRLFGPVYAPWSQAFPAQYVEGSMTGAGFFSWVPSVSTVKVSSIQHTQDGITVGYEQGVNGCDLENKVFDV